MILKLLGKKINWLFNGFLVVVLIVLLCFVVADSASRDISLEGDSLPYVRAEYKSSDLPARTWIASSIRITRRHDISDPEGARIMAYVASVYDDVLDKTDNRQQANIVTARILKELFPSESMVINNTLESFSNNLPRSLTPSSENILNKYLKKIKNDGFDRKWDGSIPADSGWYKRTGINDPAAATGSWETWVIDKKSFSMPNPPSLSGISGFIAREKVSSAVEERTPSDEETIFFWEGIDSFHNGYKNRNTIPLAGVWQNIFFTEVADELDNKKYAKYQKLLAQSIADSSIMTWKTKYTYFAPRPSMNIPRLNILIPDPPYPGFVSEHASLSHTAAYVLSSLMPEHKSVWLREARNAGNSRVLAGTNFVSDVVYGEYLGLSVGEKFVDQTLSKNKTLSFDVFSSEDSYLATLASFIHFKLSNFTENLFDLAWNLVKAQPSFTDVSEEVGLKDQYASPLGVTWADYNNDGYLDLLTAGGLYKNEQGNSFVKVNTFSDIGAPGMFGDYNNDGCIDLFIVRSGPRFSLADTAQSNLLFKNNCDGTFTNISQSSGISDVKYHSVSASWVDYNNDGYLDIYSVNNGVFKGGFAEEVEEKTPYKMEPNVLWRNNGDGTFTNVTDAAGVVGLLDCPDPHKQKFGQELKFKLAFQPTWLDYDNDNDQDLFVVIDTLVSPFYKNNGDGTFTQITDKAGLCAPGHWSNMGAAVGDYNNDEYLDIYVTNASYNFLWKNNTDSTFSNIASTAGVAEAGYGWGTESIDYNNDGFLDIIMVNGNNRLPAEEYYVEGLSDSDFDQLFKNNGDGSFSAVGNQEGIQVFNEVSFSVAVGDYNNDGFEDIMIPASKRKQIDSHSLLLKNTPNDNNWITFQLIGTESNRMGIGARVTVETENKTQVRELQVGSSYKSQSSVWPTFGLGNSESIDTVTVDWPSGSVQTFNNISNINRRVVVKEGDSKLYSSSKWKGLREIE